MIKNKKCIREFLVFKKCRMQTKYKARYECDIKLSNSILLIRENLVTARK